ncbi:hypothetical protein L6452_31896 [Arctium lappa]|uniref:Uncharacterized protein n=1 Tax=Arctium lappa TaxID=4217 RepID=A0ACB8Z2S7_ARCLA|nr:hypothetical protein L6452_31896 [Arctium lappa]
MCITCKTRHVLDHRYLTSIHISTLYFKLVIKIVVFLLQFAIQESWITIFFEVILHLVSISPHLFSVACSAVSQLSLSRFDVFVQDIANQLP